MLDFCRPWHTSWLWTWSERAVGCSTWNKMLGSGGGATAHGAGCAGRRGRWRLHPNGMLGFLARGTSDVSCGPALRIRARRALGCSLEVSTPIQLDRSVGLFSAEPDVWTWAGLPSKPGACSGLERAVGCFTWNQMDSS